MLIATGLLITWVLVVMVGHDGADDAEGRLGRRDADRGARAPVLDGPLARHLSRPGRACSRRPRPLAFVLGSYVAAEALRKRRRATRLAAVSAPVESPTRLRGAGRGPAPAGRARGRARRHPLGARLGEGWQRGQNHVPAATDAGLRDRRRGSAARLAVAPVDAELVLHRPGRTVGRDVVAQRRALTLDARPQRSPDRPRDAARPRPPSELVRRRAAG